MKKNFLLAAAVFALSVAAAYSLEVDRDELTSATDTVDFVNYGGPHDVINTIEEIRAIGSSLGAQVREAPADEAMRAGNSRYSIIHAVDPSDTSGFDADILVLGSSVAVDHIDNLRRIISAYLSAAYGYETRDGDTLAFFITVYNAVHRGDAGFFRSKYKNIVTRELSAESVGLARVYSEWAGGTQIVIPLSDPMFSGTLSTIDTTALVEGDVIQSIREDEDAPRGIRSDMTELREREGDEAQDRADAAVSEAAQARRDAARLGQEGDEARERAGQAREEAARAREEAERLGQEGDEAQGRAEQARSDEALAQQEAERLAREAEAAQAAAETARQAADEAAALAELSADDEAAQVAAEEAARAAEEREREAERLAAESEAASAQAEAAARTAEEREREAERLAAEREAASAQAEAAARAAEEQEREAAALRERQEEAERRADAAEERAEREQELADTRQEETARERREIAADTQEDLDREAAMREAAIAEADTDPALRVVDKNGFLSELMLVNSASGSPMRTSSLNSIRNRTIVDTGDAFMAVAGQGSSVRLVLIDKLTLDVTKESSEAIADESVLVASGSDYYAVVSRGGAYYVARFDKDLNVQSTSAVQVQPYTAITVSEGRIFVQDTATRIRILRSTDLIDVALGRDAP